MMQIVILSQIYDKLSNLNVLKDFNFDIKIFLDILELLNLLINTCIAVFLAH